MSEFYIVCIIGLALTGLGILLGRARNSMWQATTDKLSHEFVDLLADLAKARADAMSAAALATRPQETESQPPETAAETP